MSEEFVDQTKNCRDCQKEFILTVGEQRFYAEKEFSPPSRCKPCRDKRKAERDGGAQTQAPRQAYPARVAPPVEVVPSARRRYPEPVVVAEEGGGKQQRRRRERSSKHYRDFDNDGADF